jgi:aminopeptidase N
LGEAPAAGERVDLTFEIEGQFFTAKGGERGDVVADLSRISWYPSPTGFGDANFTFDLNVHCRKGLRPISTGDTLELKEVGDELFMHAKSDIPVSSVSLLIGKYVSYTVDLGAGRRLGVHGYGSISQDAVDKEATLIAELFKSLERLVGELPYHEIDVVEDPVNWMVFRYGRAMPGVIMVSTPMFRPFVMTQRSKGHNAGGEVLLAHELAHQWFGMLVRPASRYDNWLSESMAEYLSGMVAQNLRLDDRSVQKNPIRGWTSLYGEWDGYASWCKDWSIEAANNLAGPNADDYRYCLLYQRGPRTLHMLRGWMGDQAFLTILKRFLATYKNQLVTSDDFSSVLSKATGKDLNWYVDDWLRRGPKPPINVTAELQKTADGRSQVLAHATQPPDEFARTFVPLVWHGANGTAGVVLFMVDSADATATIPLDSVPAKVEVDPYNLNLIEYGAPKKK